MTLQVIGAAWGRTGTFSTKFMLEHLLDGKCYHMREVTPGDHEKATPWLAASRGERVDWAAVFDGYVATVDWPGAAYWEDIWAAFPDAKILLNERDPEEWFESYWTNIGASFAGSPRPEADAGDRAHLGWSAIVDRSLGGEVNDKGRMIAAYAAHVDHVKATVPADRLLVWSIKDGWAPLAKFLGVPAPSAPIPHLNKERVDLGAQVAKVDSHGDLIVHTLTAVVPPTDMEPPAEGMLAVDQPWSRRAVRALVRELQSVTTDEDEDGVWSFEKWRHVVVDEVDGRHDYLGVTATLERDGEVLDLDPAHLLEIPTVDWSNVTESVLGIVKDTVRLLVEESA